MSNLRTVSIQYGLKPPEAEADTYFCTCGHNHLKGVSHSPSLTEMALAAKPHRLPEMRKEQKATFVSMMDRVTKAETDLLRALGLPDIDDVRKASIVGEGIHKGSFELTGSKEKAVARIFDEWTASVVGDWGKKKEVSPDDVPILEMHALRAYVIGAKYTEDLIKEYMPEDMDAGIITGIFPDPEERYLNGMLRVAGNRIKSEMSRKHLDKIIPVLRQAARDGTWPIDIGMALHSLIGEGEAWWWLRIARSECVLANNAAFNAMADANGIQYEQWSAAPNACDVCSYLNGRVWRRGEGPEPVSSTHPHCCCARIPRYNAAGRIERQFTRDPYEKPYSRDEREKMREGGWLDEI